VFFWVKKEGQAGCDGRVTMMAHLHFNAASCLEVKCVADNRPSGWRAKTARLQRDLETRASALDPGMVSYDNI
jgi:hypothetical protein